MNTLNVYQSDYELINDVSWKILKTNKLEDIEFVTNAFKKLNNKYI
jgi:hypothetical protein